MRSRVFMILMFCLACTTVYGEQLTDNARKTEGLPIEQRVEKLCLNNGSKLCKQLLSDKEYRAAWFSAVDALNRAKIAVDAALLKATKELHDAEETMGKIRRNAFKLKDGSAVYPSLETGDFYDEYGTVIKEKFVYSSKGVKVERIKVIEYIQYYEGIKAKVKDLNAKKNRIN